MTNDILTPDEVDAMEAVVNAATPGPWEIGVPSEWNTVVTVYDESGTKYWLIADCLPEWAITAGCAVPDHVGNMEFISMAREVTPRLIVSYHAQAARIEELEGRVKLREEMLDAVDAFGRPR